MSFIFILRQLSTTLTDHRDSVDIEIVTEQVQTGFISSFAQLLAIVITGY